MLLNRLRVWFAEVFYGWACRLAPERYFQLSDVQKALDAERAVAQLWEMRYEKLWRRIKTARVARTVVF